MVLPMHIVFILLNLLLLLFLFFMLISFTFCHLPLFFTSYRLSTMLSPFEYGSSLIRLLKVSNYTIFKQQLLIT